MKKLLLLLFVLCVSFVNMDAQKCYRKYPYPKYWNYSGTHADYLNMCISFNSDTLDFPFNYSNNSFKVSAIDWVFPGNVFVFSVEEFRVCSNMDDFSQYYYTQQDSTYMPYVNNVNGYISSSGTYSNPSWLTSLAYSKLTGTPTIPAAQVNSDWNAGSGVAQILNKPTIPTLPTLSFNNAPGRSVVTGTGATGFQVSSTRAAIVNYSVTISTTVSLAGNSTGYVVLQICPTNSATPGDWIEVARTASGQSGTLVIGLTLNQTGGGNLSAVVPAGYYAKLLSVNTAGTPTYTYNSGQEVLFN